MKTKEEIKERLAYLKGYIGALSDVEIEYERRTILSEQITALEWVLEDE